jgi:hypothetical protein
MNGFLGELAIYFASFLAIKSGDAILVSAGFITAVSLALTGGFASAAYAKVIGCTFLGEPRSEAAANAVETPKRMWISQLFLTIISLAMIPGTILFIDYATNGYGTKIFIDVSIFSGIFFLLTLLILLFRRFICPRGKEKPRRSVWDCGYDKPTPRMAYTATAFTQPLVDLFRPFLRSRRHVIPFKGDPSSPSDAAIACETDDLALGRLWRPLFTRIARIFQIAHLLQNGSLHLYIMIIIIAVMVLLASALMS